MKLIHGLLRVLLLSVALTLGCRDSSSPDGAEGVPNVYQIRSTNSEDGTGRFYMGREIASVTGIVGSEWLDRPTRETMELPNRVIQALELKPSEVVADIGAGTGYFTFRIAPLVPRGRVLAVDIQQEMLDIIRRRATDLDINNVETILGSETDPNLPEESIDLALIVFSYTQFSHPFEMMQNVIQAVQPGGRVVLVEYRGEDPTIPRSPLHKISEEQARQEMEAIGLRWRETRAILPQQHFIVFEKPTE